MPTEVLEIEPGIILARGWGDTSVEEFACRAVGPITDIADRIGNHVIIADLSEQNSEHRAWRVMARKALYEISKNRVVVETLQGIGFVYATKTQKISCTGIMLLLGVKYILSASSREVREWARGTMSGKTYRPPQRKSLDVQDRVCCICGSTFRPLYAESVKQTCSHKCGVEVERRKRENR